MDKGKWRSLSMKELKKGFSRFMKKLGVAALALISAAGFFGSMIYLAKNDSPLFYYALALSSPASVFENANVTENLSTELSEEAEAPPKAPEPLSTEAPASEIVSGEELPEVPENRRGIVTEKFYSPAEGGLYIKYNNAMIKNCTKHSKEKILSNLETESEIALEQGAKEPQVFIYHTHATEGFEPYDRGYFDLEEDWRSTDTAETVVALGDRICEVLGEKGIATAHDTTLHDDPSYKGSYKRSAVTVKNALSENQSIKICLDIHRDAIEPSEKEIIKPTAVIDGKKAAQIMVIAGCDDGTMNMPDYWQNFRFAVKLADKMGEKYPGLCRFVLFDYRKYNMDLSEGLLLIEIGATGNTLDEALYSAELLADVLTEM